MTDNLPETHNSSILEKLLEHQFVASLTASLWRRGFRDIEVLRAEVDAFGHDIVIEAGGILRHIQLKSSHRDARTARVNIHSRLATKPSGCVIWYLYDRSTLELGPFRWFGSEPGTAMPPLGDRIARDSRGNRQGQKAEREDIRVLPKARFDTLATIDDLADTLFGPGRVD
ncbi:hypothetical protein GRI38_10530 [Altererythrobacter aurantiacus]|uniref:PD(D/E)XK endonuclease domain-containing protein n=1 Tax=Parapontixanthobacter aurantiacus TaxID=1463599 RepID=A0A844ZHL2_9SPHN|nr:hypothetical protein [Parapontixanthobacter aurantiacus]MXO86460.1 hypothetical protein [Parapontixanthobacter aurantiacus]